MQNLNPYVRFARTNEKTIPQEMIQAIDHRIFYCHSGDGVLAAGNATFRFTAGTLIYIPAGTPYKYLFDQNIPVFSGCNFDFFQDHRHLSTPIPPEAQAGFCPDRILEMELLKKDWIFSKCIHLENAFSFEDKFVEIAEEFIHHNLYYDVRCSTLLKDVLIQTARLATRHAQGINSNKMNEILQYIHSHYHLPLSNKDIAKQFHYHENHLNSIVLKYTGLTLHQYVLHYKMQMALIFLQSSPISVGEVAEKVGMPDIKHFSKCFKKIIGHSPSEFIFLRW